MNAITLDQLDAFQQAYDQDPVQRAVRRALYKSNVMALATAQENEQNMRERFSVDIKTMSATSQGKSGRCWIFAGLNVLREEVAKKLNLENFELSQNYTAFYDKLEKINFFMESVIELRGNDWDERTLWWVLQNGVSDGGQWNMLTATIRKYGVVPKDAMPESFQSSETRDMNQLINRRLRRFAVDVKKAADEAAIAKLKEEALGELYGFLCSCFGVPPKSFNFEYVDKDGNYNLVKDMTPKAFFDTYVGMNFDDYVSIIHSPTPDKPYYNRFTVKYLGSEVTAPVTHLNLPMDAFKAAVRKQLEDGAVVWFGSDCGNFINREQGTWDMHDFDLQALFSIDFSLDKENTLMTRDGAMNHAMVLTGVNIVDDKPTKWKIENSWGTENGRKGYYACSDDWFNSYVYQAVVNKKYLSEEALAALEKTPVMVEPWDPMGTLAD